MTNLSHFIKKFLYRDSNIGFTSGLYTLLQQKCEVHDEEQQGKINHQINSTYNLMYDFENIATEISLNWCQICKYILQSIVSSCPDYH